MKLNISDYHKNQLLMAVFQYLTLEQRLKIMKECPQAYNAIMGEEVVKVFRKEGGAV